CALLVPLVWLAGPITVRRTGLYVVVVGALVSPWIAFNLATAGRPLPATASAKIEGGLMGWLSGVREPAAVALVMRPWQFAVEWVRWLGSVDALFPLLAPIGLGMLWRVRGRRLGLPAAALIVHPLGMALLAA